MGIQNLHIVVKYLCAFFTTEQEIYLPKAPRVKARTHKLITSLLSLFDLKLRNK